MCAIFLSQIRMKPKDLSDNIVEITLPKSSAGKDGTEKELLSESIRTKS